MLAGKFGLAILKRRGTLVEFRTPVRERARRVVQLPLMFASGIGERFALAVVGQRLAAKFFLVLGEPGAFPGELGRGLFELRALGVQAFAVGSEEGSLFLEGCAIGCDVVAVGREVALLPLEGAGGLGDGVVFVASGGGLIAKTVLALGKLGVSPLEDLLLLFEPVFAPGGVCFTLLEVRCPGVEVEGSGPELRQLRLEAAGLPLAGLFGGARFGLANLEFVPLVVESLLGVGALLVELFAVSLVLDTLLIELGRLGQKPGAGVIEVALACRDGGLPLVELLGDVIQARSFARHGIFA